MINLIYIKEKKYNNFSSINESSNLKNNNKIQHINNLISGSKILLKLEEESVAFPTGEHYYQLIKDTNKSNLINKNDNLSERIELFFTLIEVCNPNDLHSFGISIINNKNIGTQTFLGYLENKKGEEIVFGDCYEVEFFFEREQIIIIEPNINSEKTEKKEKFDLCKLMTSLENKISLNIDNIGVLEITYKKL